MAQRTPRRSNEEIRRSSGTARQRVPSDRRYEDPYRERDYRRPVQSKRRRKKKKGTAGLVVLLIVLLLLAGGIFYVLQSGILKKGDNGLPAVQKPLPEARRRYRH